ncbi:MAG: EFR1 family ferrodoxin, partial [Clostridiales bacterium]|nr:EFR1 family ferrodoxin [Clostridiales bacterium]
MILYFSGTGNSEYTAKRIREETDDNIMNLGEKIRSRDFSSIHSDTPWVVAAPTYAWRIPRILQEWLEKTELTGNRTIYFVMTCGGNIGNAGRYLKKLTDAKGLNYAGCAQIIMPENYIAMFATPTQEEAAGIIRGSLRAIDEAARQIKDSRPFPQLPITRKDKINSSIVNILFYPMFVHAKKFQATSACTSCGK